MAYEPRAGGALFSNDRKEKENHPDYKGDLLLDATAVASIIEQHNSGVEFPKLDMSGWKKTSGKGVRFLSLSASKPWVKTGERAAVRLTPPPANDFDDSIPF
tara:strand:- start:1609 stop:1914 length:306 start_codon:yes stop_codon:yes gene_type:complete